MIKNSKSLIPGCELRSLFDESDNSVSLESLGLGDILPNNTKDCRFISTEGQVITDIDLSLFNFEGSNFNACKFVRCNFANSLLLDCLFIDCSFYSCDFHEANLANSNFLGGEIRDTRLSTANLTRVRFEQTILSDLDNFIARQHLQTPFLIKRQSWDPKPKGTLSFLKWLLFVSLWHLRMLAIVVFSMPAPTSFKSIAKSELRGDFDSALYLYRTLRISLTRIGNGPDARAAAFLHNRAELLANKSGFLRKIFGWLSFGFGFYMSPAHILFISFITVMGFSGFYYYNGKDYYYLDTFNYCTEPVEDVANPNERCFKLTPLDDKYYVSLSFTEAVYYSAVTFATLGYGDISPRKWPFENDDSLWSLWPPAIEALIGAVCMALAVAAIIRSASFS
jgi:Zn-finger protein